ncbi:hypothetical protein JB92DRAFT_2957067 [Gautieria morchelliformis]|nr:hypothetical protein JB92DRAFT_2957067 [Gautieria morchelliformis]
MPAPGIYVVGVVAVVAGVAAGIAFKEFVYDPHLAPKIEQWADTYTAYRIARRRRRAASHSYSHLDPDGEGENPNLTTKSTMELESLVEREMHTLGPDASLRQRKPHMAQENGLGILEKPNTIIPFAPLSPSHLPPPSKSSSSREDVAMPIVRLPTSQSDQPSSPPVPASAGPLTGDLRSQTQPLSPPDSVLPPLRLYGPPASHVASSMSEYDFPLAASGTSPFTSASVSRAGTPWTDAPSESSANIRSGASSSDDLSEASFVSDIEDSYPDLDASHHHVTVTGLSQASLNNQSVLSLDEHSETSFSISPSADTRSDSSFDFSASEGDHQEALIDMRSPRSALGVLSDEEWESIH